MICAESAVGEEVGKTGLGVPRALCRSKTIAARKSGLERLGVLVIPYLAATSSSSSRSWAGGHGGRKALKLPVDLDHRLVEEGGRTDDRAHRVLFSQFGARPRNRFRPLRHLAGETPLEPQQPPQVRGQDKPLQIPLGKDDHGFFAEVPLDLLGRLVAGGIRVDQRVVAASVGSCVAATPAATARRTDTAEHRPCMADRPGRDCAQSIESGPVTSALRNWWTNWFSESNSSSLGPDSTILPFQSTAMKSAIRRAVLRSWLITR